jgi:hypothetical protein
MRLRKADQRLMKEWIWLLDGYKLLGGGPLGDLILEKDQHHFWFDINSGRIKSVDDTWPELPDEFFMANLVAKLEDAGLTIGSNECFAFKIPPIVGGKFDDLENVYVGNWEEYNGWMASFHYQTKDLPDGAKIKLKVTE